MDTIRGQDAINAIYEAFCYAYCDNCEKEMNEDLCGDCHRKYQNWSASKKTIEKVINNLPSAEPERKKGKWVNDGGLYKCSNCNHLFSELWWVSCCPIDRMNKIMPFCPRCGAEMVERREDDND